MYEDAIKNYEGEDPLENWYEYILWVEQSYPKRWHESHIGRLLQQCLAIFEKETKYHQDRRYIRLWINYVSDILCIYRDIILYINNENLFFFLDKYAKESLGIVPVITQQWHRNYGGRYVQSLGF